MTSKYNSLVRELVRSSVNDKGIVELSLVEEVLSALRESKPLRHLEILRLYLCEIKKKLRLQYLEIELGCQPNESIVADLKNKISQISSRSLDLRTSYNEHLIAGYRLRLVDDVFEDSIQSRLSKLSQSLTL